MSQNTQLGVQVVADIADFQKKFEDMKGQIGGVTESLQKSTGDLAAASGEAAKSGEFWSQGKTAIAAASAAAAAGAVVMTNAAKDAGKYAESIQQMAQKSGLPPQIVQEWSLAFERQNKSISDLSPSFRILAKNYQDAIGGSDKAIQKFTDLGVTVGDLKSLDKPGELIKFLADRVASMNDGMEKTAAVAAVFGRSGAELIPILDGGSAAFDDAARAMHEMGAVLEDDTIEALGRLDDKFDDINKGMAGISNNLGAAFAPATEAMANQVGTMIGHLSSLLQWLTQTVPAGVREFAGIFTAAFAVTGPLVLAAQGLTALLGVALAPLLIKGALIAGLIAGLTYVITNWESIGKRIQDFGQAFNATIASSVEKVLNTFTTLKEKSIKLIGDMVTEIGRWMGEKLTTLMNNPVMNAVTKVLKALGYMKDEAVDHSIVPDMVRDIGATMDELPARMAQPTEEAAEKVLQHMTKLDRALTAPARNAAISVENSFRGIGVTADDVFRTLTDRMAYFSGSAIQTISNTLAQGVTGMANWKQAGEQLLNSFLVTFINAALSMTTSWLIAEATRTAATETANATIAASGAVTSTGLMAVFSTAGMAIKSIMIGLAQGVVSIIGVVVSGISTVLEGISFVLSFALEAIAEMIFAAAAAVQSIPIVGQILGAIMIGAGILVQAASVALPALIAGVGGLLSAGVGALSAAIPAFATGGAVFGPTLALVGENASRGNPEYIGHANQLGLNQGGGRQTIIVQLDGRTLAEATMPHMYGVYRLAMGNR